MAATAAGVLSMLRRPKDDGPDHIVFLLVHKFSMVAFTAAIEPLRLANYVTAQTLYTWEIVSQTGDPVQASNGLTILPDRAATELITVDNIVVCTGLEGQFFRDPTVLRTLRRLASTGAHIGSLCTGSYVLARAGLMGGYHCTVHWECLDSFIDEFPDIAVEGALYKVDRDRFTCAGGTAATDMMLGEIAMRHGEPVALAVSDQFMHERRRDSADSQRLPIQARHSVKHPKLVQAIQVMEMYCEDLLDRDVLAHKVGVSPRQLERLFKRYLDTSPARYYLKLRLHKAHRMLVSSSLPVSEVAMACGFTSLSHFAKSYREIFGRAPVEEHGKKPRPPRIIDATADPAYSEAIASAGAGLLPFDAIADPLAPHREPGPDEEKAP